METYSLSELTSMISAQFKESFGLYWVTAEIQSMSVSGGHCYLDLAEKDEESEEIKAMARATIWKYCFKDLKNKFEQGTGIKLEKGLKVLVKVRPVFHERYGFSLNVSDIDETYTIGDFERQKREIVLKLSEMGVLEKNKQLSIPLFAKRIALISSETAAGCQDFIKQLANCPYSFELTIYPAVVQGVEAEDSVIAAIDAVEQSDQPYDVLVIVRGGGSVADLHCFNSFKMALRCAESTLPIITGIGHDRDVSIVDLVAACPQKTPTAAAQYIIDMAAEAETRLLYCIDELKQCADKAMRDSEQKIESLRKDLFTYAKIAIDKCDYKLQLMEKELMLSSPDIVLQKGYALITKDGELANAGSLHNSDVIEIEFSDGKIKAVVL